MIGVVGQWRRMWVWMTGAVLILFLVSGASGAELVAGRIVSVGIGGSGGKGGMYRLGCWVPVRVHVENRTAGQFVGSLAVEQLDLDGDHVMSIGPELVLPAGDVEGRDVWLYYWPRPDDDGKGAHSVVVLNGKDKGSQVVGTMNAEGRAVGLDEKDDINGHWQRFVVLLGGKSMGFGSYLDAYGGTAAVRWAQATLPKQLPDNVLGYDGVDTIVWQADMVKPSDVPPDFQLKAMLEWVRDGGHLIISVGSQPQEFLKADERLRAAMPIVLTGTREIKISDLGGFAGLAEKINGLPPGIKDERLVQAIGTVRAGAREISGGKPKGFEEHPLAVTGMYGRGAVTVLTIDAGNPILEKELPDENWMGFWNQVAGWQGQVSQMKSKAMVENERRRPQGTTVTLSSKEAKLGEKFSAQVDVAEDSAVRFLVGVLFLGLYWLVAGPIGHLVLKYYKLVHWSWWIFGGTVIAAAAVAGGVVTFLKISNYDLRHKTVVIGTVGSRDVSTVSFYGVLLPGSGGNYLVTQPEGVGGVASGEMNYLAPLCVPTYEGVKPFADPQSYALYNERPNDAMPIFRNTLKKMQGRWTGEMDGIRGNVSKGGVGTPLLTGTLTNESGYDLEHVEIFIHVPSPGYGQGRTFMYQVGNWIKGRTIDVSADAKVEVDANGNAVSLEDRLEEMAKQYAGHSFGAAPGAGLPANPLDQNLLKNRQDELINLLLDVKKVDSLTNGDRPEVMRGSTRAMDCTKMLYASGGLIVATAGDIANKQYVKSPVPVSVDKRVVEGKGDILFAWGLPVAGDVDTSRLGVEAPEPKKEPENVQGNRRPVILRPGAR